MTYSLVLGDCLTWLDSQPDSCFHAVVTDPPYGLKEYSKEEQEKLRQGQGGVWRIPPCFDGSQRSPLPRFTVLTPQDHENIKTFFSELAKRLFRILVPGAHVFIASNPLVSHLVYVPFVNSGFEKRGEVIRLVQTLRGGDRPKNAETEFPDVSVMPRAQWEPWGLFRKPCEGTVAENLRKYGTGGLRRVSNEEPFGDVIQSAPTHTKERKVSPHPSLKPQAFMRRVVRASLPLGTGVLLDPFMGGGSTIAAAEVCGYDSVGVELDQVYFESATKCIPALVLVGGKHV